MLRPLASTQNSNRSDGGPPTVLLGSLGTDSSTARVVEHTERLAVPPLPANSGPSTPTPGSQAPQLQALAASSPVRLSPEFHAAILNGDTAQIRGLLATGLNLNTRATADGESALHAAARAGHEYIVYLLVNKASEQDIHHLGDQGASALDLAAEAGHMGVVELLLTKSPSPTQKESALARAIAQGHVDIVRHLLCAQAALSGKATLSALMQAALTGNVAAMDLLLAEGDDPNAVSSGQDSALLLAVKAGQLDAVRRLLAASARIDQLDREGNSALLLAAAAGKVQMVKLLAKTGVHHANNEGNTALHLAARAGHFEVAQRLLVKGAQCEQQNKDGDTPLTVAAAHGQARLVQLLLLNKANVDHANSKGETALMQAAERGDGDLADALLAAGANKYKSNKAKATAADLADKAGQSLLVLLLADRAMTSNPWMPDPYSKLRRSPIQKRNWNQRPYDPLYSEARYLKSSTTSGSCDSASLDLIKAVASRDQNQLKRILWSLQAQCWKWAGDLDLAPEEAAKLMKKEVNRSAPTEGLVLNPLITQDVSDSLVLIRGPAEKRKVTPLLAAAIAGNTEAVKWLLGAGANPQLMVRDQPSALVAAVLSGEASCVACLLAAGAGLEYRWRDMTALTLAALLGHKAVVRLLLDAGAEADLPFAVGRNFPFALATLSPQVLSPVKQARFQQMFGYLLKDLEGLPPASASAETRSEIVQMLIDAGALASDAKKEQIKAALCMAAWSGNVPILKILLPYGSGETQAAFRFASLLAALLSEQEDTVRFLLDTHIPMNLPTAEVSVGYLTIAALTGNCTTLALLLKAGAQVDAVNVDGMTALMSVMKVPFSAEAEAEIPLERRRAVAALLVQAGADPQRKDNQGRSYFNPKVIH